MLAFNREAEAADLCEFEVNLVYMVSSRTSQAMKMEKKEGGGRWHQRRRRDEEEEEIEEEANKEERKKEGMGIVELAKWLRSHITLE